MKILDATLRSSALVAIGEICQTRLKMDSATPSAHQVAVTVSPHVQLEWFLLHAGFVLIGIITASLGPLIPVYTKIWGITDAQAGFFFPAQYFTSLLGVIATTWLLPRFGFSKVLGIGFLFLTMGMGFLGVSPWFLTAGCVGLAGYGYGLTNPTTNVRGTQLPSKNVAAAVSLLNFSWGVGAVACPFLVAALVPRIGVRGFGLCVAALTMAVCVTHFMRKVPTRAVTVERPKHSLADWKHRLGIGQAVPLVLLFFLYVGVEASFGGWVAALEKRLPGSRQASALAIAPSVFYGCLLFGRGLAPVMLRRWSTLVITIGGILITASGGVAVAVTDNKAVLLVGVAAAGFGCASLFPVYVTWMAQIFREDAGWIGALYFSAAALGGAILPQMVGIIATETHSLRVGILVPLVASVIMFFLTMKARPHAE
jgi:FHS family glucose/mannose:H+ symporter-like MFS transporter